ncbi:MAG: hypothetical protein IJ420_12800 [Lachnospiraceae bacterium]|nr:hypothetical protein [Lachnospiraceae bacterium]MBQ9135477.1 hypothetical protein [Lachnospiraceae bacterium]
MTKKEQDEKLRMMDLPQPIVTGAFEMTEEEQKKADEALERIIQELQGKAEGARNESA